MSIAIACWGNCTMILQLNIHNCSDNILPLSFILQKKYTVQCLVVEKTQPRYPYLLLRDSINGVLWLIKWPIIFCFSQMKRKKSVIVFFSNEVPQVMINAANRFSGSLKCVVTVSEHRHLKNMLVWETSAPEERRSVTAPDVVMGWFLKNNPGNIEMNEPFWPFSSLKKACWHYTLRYVLKSWRHIKNEIITLLS